jgi:hypothetical protein
MASLRRPAPRRYDRRLLSAALAPRTVATYTAAARRFLAWVQEVNAAPLDDELFDDDDLDQVLVEYFHDMFDRGFGKSIGSQTISALCHFMPTLRTRLFDAHLAVRGWNRLKPTVSHPPISWPLACLVAVQMYRHGEDWYADAVGVLVAFMGLLRVGELVGLRREHVCDSRDPDQIDLHDVNMDGAVLVLPNTKTGGRKNQLQQVVLNARLAGVAPVRDLLFGLRNRTAQHQHIFPSSARLFRRRFEHAVRELRLPARYVPHSLRHGGATYLLLHGTNIEDVMIKGRWAVSKSARTYLQAGRASLLVQGVPPAIAAAAATVAGDVRSALTLVREQHAQH